MRIVETHTGKIYVDKDKQLEFLTVGDYGKENNIKASFLGLNKEINGVQHHTVDLADKWVATISTQKGCPMNCQFCDCPKYGFHGNVKKWALDNGYSTLTKLANDMDMCASLVSRLLIKGEAPTKRSIRKITEFTEMSADEVFYLPDIAA